MKTASSFCRLLTTATLVLLVGFGAAAKASEPTPVLTLAQFQDRFGGSYLAASVVVRAGAPGLGISGGYDISAGQLLLGLNAGLDWTSADTHSNWQTGLRARVSAPIGRILPYVQGGVVFDGQEAGWEVGAGVAVSISRGWSIELAASHQAIDNQETSSVLLGLRFDIPGGGVCEVKELCPPPPPPKDGGVK